MKATRTTQKRSRKLLPLIIISAVVLAGLGYFGYAYATKDAWPFEAQTADTMTTEDGINYSPPTEQELNDSQDGKKNSASQDENNSSSSASTRVSIGIAYAGYDEEEGMIDIRAFTTDVVEGTGTCTATLTKDGKTVTRTSKAFVDSSSSQCEPILINTGDFPSGGTWDLTVSYKSDTSSGVSASMKVEVNQ